MGLSHNRCGSHTHIDFPRLQEGFSGLLVVITGKSDGDHSMAQIVGFKLFLILSPGVSLCTIAPANAKLSTDYQSGYRVAEGDFVLLYVCCHRNISKVQKKSGSIEAMKFHGIIGHML